VQWSGELKKQKRSGVDVAEEEAKRDALQNAIAGVERRLGNLSTCVVHCYVECLLAAAWTA
jgi:hypothetical protein